MTQNTIMIIMLVSVGIHTIVWGLPFKRLGVSSGWTKALKAMSMGFALAMIARLFVYAFTS